jgi:hypothetical protein
MKEYRYCALHSGNCLHLSVKCAVKFILRHHVKQVGSKQAKISLVTHFTVLG